MAKRRAHGEGSISQRKNGTWYARYTAGFDPGTGKQIQKSVYGKTQKEVAQMLKKITSALDEGTFIEPSKMTIGTWLDIWLSEYAKNAVKVGTFNMYTRHVNYYIKPRLASIKLTALATHMIQTVYNDLLTTLSGKTVRNIHGILHKALEQAVKLNYIKINPSNACVLPRRVKPEIKPLEEQQITDFLQAMNGHKFEVLYMITLFTGIRQSEALGLCWNCVDFDNGVITVEKQLLRNEKNSEYYVSSVKNSKKRLITPAPYLMKLLLEHRDRQTEASEVAAEAWVLPQAVKWVDDGQNWETATLKTFNFVFTNELGEHLKHVTAYKNYKKLIEKTGVNARFHDMRHTYAVAAMQSGDIIAVQETLGHHSAAFTLDQYGHYTKKMRKQSAEYMESFIMGVQPS